MCVMETIPAVMDKIQTPLREPKEAFAGEQTEIFLVCLFINSAFSLLAGWSLENKIIVP